MRACVSAVLPISRAHDRQACFQRVEIHNIHINMPSSAIVAINENADCIGWKWKYGLRLKRFRRYNMVASLGFPAAVFREAHVLLSHWRQMCAVSFVTLSPLGALPAPVPF